MSEPEEARGSSRPVTLFTGQWADLPLETRASRAASWGFDGLEFVDRIYHVHIKDSRRRLDGRRSILGSHLGFGEEQRGWDFVSPGHGDVDFEALLRALNRIGYAGPLSIEWEDSGMDREHGSREALGFVRRSDFPPSQVAFDAAMQGS